MTYKFKNNKYTNLYYKIIANAALKTRLRSELSLENHHIVPRSCGGTNIKTNLILLTPREHFVCHLLLVKMVNDCDIYKMSAALARFGKKISSREYHVLRSVLSWASRGRYNKSFGKKWMHDPITKEIYYLTANELAVSGKTLIVGLPCQRGGNHNTTWVNNGTIEMLISKGATLSGWKKGRLNAGSHEQMQRMSKSRHTPEKDKLHSQKLTGRVTITNTQTNECMRIHPNELNNYLMCGWIRQSRSSKPKPCSIDNHVFKNVSDAVRYHKISHNEIRRRLKSDAWPTWIYVQE